MTLPATTNNAAAAPSTADAYNQFVRSSPQGILYDETWWLDAVAPGRYQILKVEDKGRIQAAWPIVWERPDDREFVTMPPLTQKLGILFEPLTSKYAEQLSAQHRLTRELIDQLPSDARVSQRFHENFTNWLPFYWTGFEQTTRYTYVFEDLSDLDRIWNGMRSALHRQIRKAVRADLRIREIDDPELFYRMNKKSFERQDVEIPYDLDLVVRIDKACVDNAGRRMLLAEDSAGRIHAADYLVYDSRCAISLLRGADVELRASGASCLLQWEMIQFASTVSQRFDFEGSMMEPLERHIRTFGARQMPYSTIYGHRRLLDSKTPSSAPRRLLGRVLRKLAQTIDPI